MVPYSSPFLSTKWQQNNQPSPQVSPNFPLFFPPSAIHAPTHLKRSFSHPDPIFFITSEGMTWFQCSRTFSRGPAPTPRKSLKTPSLPLGHPSAPTDLTLYKSLTSPQCAQECDETLKERTSQSKWFGHIRDPGINRKRPLTSPTVSLTK